MREKETERGGELQTEWLVDWKKKNEFAHLVIVCEIQAAPCRYHLIPRGLRRTQRLGGLLWERCFICVCYVQCYTTWISVLCISLNPQRSWHGQAPLRPALSLNFILLLFPSSQSLDWSPLTTEIVGERLRTKSNAKGNVLFLGAFCSDCNLSIAPRKR